MTTRRRRQTGFTLIEMMVVTAILALVAMTVFPNLARIQAAGR
ncbi:MAG: type II secretion system GspH family protein [Nitrospirae bacterium]|nr:type II secretion system GspH family protein [Fimbriimonadaceae bacterium]